MSLIQKCVDMVGQMEKSFDVDSLDRIKYVYTNWIIWGTALFVFNKNYVGQSVQCWIPKQMKPGWEKYIETYCLIENTYYVPMNDTHLPDVHKRADREMVYYQWVPFMLVLMGVFLYIPRFAWTTSQKRLQLDLPSITVGLRKAAKKNEVFQFSEMAVDYQSRWGSKLTIGLIFTKFFSIIVITLQLSFMNWFLGPSYTWWGYGVLHDLLHGRHWQESGHFPRVTFCDVQIRELGGAVHNWTLQCVLMVNMFNEKIFLFLWWWLVLLLAASIVNLCFWIVRILNQRDNVMFVKSLLEINQVDIDDDNVFYFVESSLKTDGCVVLRLIADNATIFKAADYVKPLYYNYTRRMDTTNVYTKRFICQ